MIFVYIVAALAAVTYLNNRRITYLLSVGEDADTTLVSMRRPPWTVAGAFKIILPPNVSGGYTGISSPPISGGAGGIVNVSDPGRPPINLL